MKRDIKPHIGIFGRRNSGKSSLINLITNQEIAIVSGQPGTTTDPVSKTVEIPSIGPVVIVDTAGIDDEGELGTKRVKRSLEVIKRVDCAVLLISGNQFGSYELSLIENFNSYSVPYITVHNKSDQTRMGSLTKNIIREHTNTDVIDFSIYHSSAADKLIAEIKKIIPESIYRQPSLINDIVSPGDIILFVITTDSEAPEGRLILPQNIAIRNALDSHCVSIVINNTELDDFLKHGIKPNMVITDSQVFDEVGKKIPDNIPLTSFSIIFARQKGYFDKYLEGTPHISKLKDGDKVLIMESCTHQINCSDIGRVQIPKLLKRFTGKELTFSFVSGLSEISDINSFSLVIQCGGCMVTRKQLTNRLNDAIKANIPITNYGMALAYVNGIFDRAVNPFSNKIQVCQLNLF